MGLVIWIIFGGLIGWTASVIVVANKTQARIADITVGVVGALIGGYASLTFGGLEKNGFNMVSLLMAIASAVALLSVVKLFSRAAS